MAPTHQIIQEGFELFNVKAKDALVKNNKRKGYSRKYYQDIINARCVIIAKLSRYPEWSTYNLCELFGFKSSTIIRSVQRGKKIIN